jgi:hypothetical protein
LFLQKYLKILKSTSNPPTKHLQGEIAIIQKAGLMRLAPDNPAGMLIAGIFSVGRIKAHLYIFFG